MPLLFVSREARASVRTGPLSEGFRTGITNSTTGALLGALAWGFGGPPGGALFYAISGAGALGAVSGGMQALFHACSNWDRAFADRCDKVLQACRRTDVTVERAFDMAQLMREAETEAQRRLVADMAATALRIAGNEVDEECRIALRRLAPSVAPEEFGGEPEREVLAQDVVDEQLYAAWQRESERQYAREYYARQRRKSFIV